MIDSDCRITFLGMDGVEPARIEVRAWLPRLGKLTAELIGAHVQIEAIDERRQQRTYAVRMELTMPGASVLVTHDHPSNAAHEDLYVAIRNAFRAARRQLEEYFTARGAPPVMATVTAGAESPSTVSAPEAPKVPSEDGQRNTWPEVSNGVGAV